MGWKKLLRTATKAASVARDAEVLASGDPEKIARRAKNKIVSRLLYKIGFWK